jgi:conjugative transposon TraN protein
MKNLFMTIPILIFQLSLFAQNYLPVSDSKATHLVCPDKVSYLQVGDPTLILAEVVPELPNLVRIKATGSFEKESSLTVVCAGRIYSLILDFEDSEEITYDLESFHFEKAGGSSSGLMPDYVLKALSEQILLKRKSLVRGVKQKKDGIKVQLKTITQKNGFLFFEVRITNKTNLAYRVESFHWWIDDRKQFKATNTQEYQIEPRYRYHEITVIPGYTTVREVFVLPNLVLPDKRVLRLEMIEKALGNTGRRLIIEIKNKDILKAKELISN